MFIIITASVIGKLLGPLSNVIMYALLISVPAQWTPWTSWSTCSLTCGPGATRRRSRTFIPGRHGGKTLPDEDLEETQYCAEDKEFPTPCPRDCHASQSEWESWSSCSEQCYPEGSQPPMIHRRRKCIEATLAKNWKFNTNIKNCTDLLPVTESKLCGSPCLGEMSGWGLSK